MEAKVMIDPAVFKPDSEAILAVRRRKPRTLGSRRLREEASKAMQGHSTKLISKAIETLTELGGPSSGRILLNFVIHSSSSRRGEAVEAIETISYKYASPYLLALLNKTSDSLLRVCILDCLGEFRYKKAQRIVEPLLNSRSELIRMYAAFALGRIGRGRSVALLQQRLTKERSSGVKVFAKSALVSLGHGALEDVLEHLYDPDYRARCAAANSLYELATARTVASIQAALRAAHQDETFRAPKSTFGKVLLELAEAFPDYVRSET